MKGGTYALADGTWLLELEPHVAIRVRRALPRVQSTRGGAVIVQHSEEMCREIEWLAARFNLSPADDASGVALADGAAAHRAMEDKVAAIIAAPATVAPVTPREISPLLTKTPREYQQQVHDLARARRRFLLGDEVGLGKTLSALLIAQDPDALPMAVVVPTHLPPRWVDELGESLPSLTYHVAKSTTPPKAFEKGPLPDVVILSYSKVVGWKPVLANRVKTVVFDEVQDLRRGDMSMKGVASAAIADKALNVIGCTATPVYNYGGEVWQLLNIIAPGELGSLEEFTREWGMPTGNGHVSVKNPAALGQYLRATGLLLARTRAQVGRELPATVKVPMEVDADESALDAIASDATRLAQMILNSSTSSADRFQASGEIDWKLRQATGIAKAPAVAGLVEMLLESEERVIIAGWHRAVYDVWLERLRDHKPVMFTGTESPAQKQKSLEAFTKGDSRVLLMSLRSGAGVDGLQKVCSVVVFGELDWSPEVHEQLIGRLRRDTMDEAKPVVAYFPHSTIGSDPPMIEVLQVKRNQAEPIMSTDGKLFTGRAITAPDRARALATAFLARAAA